MCKVIIDYKATSEILKKCRMEKNISIQELAKHTSISIPLLRSYEATGKLTSLINTVALANYYDISLDELIPYKVI